ncbi:MAG: class I SAM-dependent methyltransferase [Fimbriimonadaceae bacterium]|nr:class I SAM-dependent methyltransferase [Alphaproteobacteria bacterium]
MEMSEHTASQKKFFPATAMPDRVWWSNLWPDPGNIVRMLGIKAGMKVVDLCCGDGYFTAPLAKLVNGKVYALDIDPEMLNQARSEVARLGVSVNEWLNADAQSIAEVVPHEIDYVLIANTFHGVQDKTALAKAVRQVLKPGGRFVIVNWHQIAREQTVVLDKPRGPKTEMRMSPEQVQKVVESTGFQLADLVELPPYHYGAIFQRQDCK